MRPFKPVLAFIYERQRIYHRKTSNQPWPWTLDPILQRTKINNIFRRFDAFTQFELDAIRDLTPAHQVRFIVVARYILSRQLMTFLVRRRYRVTPRELLAFKAQVGGGYNYINEVIQFYRPTSGSTETQICTHLQHARTRATRFVHDVHACQTPTDVCRLIRHHFPQLGRFRIYEVYTSLTYLPWFPFTENDLLEIGPGSRQMAKQFGLRTLEDFQQKAAEIDRLLKRRRLNYGQTFTVRSLEDTLCEFRKYTIAKIRPVKVYKPAWFPRLACHPKYVGPSYPFGRVAICDKTINDPNKRFALAILPVRVGRFIAALRHRRHYTRQDLATVKPSLRDLNHFLPTLVQLQFFRPLAKDTQ